MKRVFKETVPVDDEWHILNRGLGVVHVGYQRSLDGSENVTFWFEHMDGYKLKEAFRVYGTGHPVSPVAEYVGTTFGSHGLVWHLYSAPASAL